jgi:DNA-binding NtrC family response regulator
MPFETATQETNEATTPRAGLTSGVPDEARILILGDDEPDIERLKTVFREADFSAETATSITAGCEAAKSGRFQVVVSVPVLSDGSWRRLIDIANRHDLGFEVVLLARTFDLSQRAEALEDGAFDVLDVVHGLPKAAQTVKGALWAAYLKGTGPCPEAA